MTFLNLTYLIVVFIAGGFLYGLFDMIHDWIFEEKGEDYER